MEDNRTGIEVDITFRDATPQDAHLLAWTVMTAIGADWKDLSRAELMCSAEDTLYSWKRARIAMVGEMAAGCLISYPGEDYEKLRDHTWSRYWGAKDYSVGSFENETFPGEYYLDSLAVLPEFRGMGIGKKLLLDGIAKGHSLGFDRITLIAESDAPKLQDYYKSIGFHPEDHMEFFGHDYIRMSVNTS